MLYHTMEEISIFGWEIFFMQKNVDLWCTIQAIRAVFFCVERAPRIDRAQVWWIVWFPESSSTVRRRLGAAGIAGFFGSKTYWYLAGNGWEWGLLGWLLIVILDHSLIPCVKRTSKKSLPRSKKVQGVVNVPWLKYHHLSGCS